MTADQQTTIEIKLRAVAAQAESLALDIRKGQVWNLDELRRKLSAIYEPLNDARTAANR